MGFHLWERLGGAGRAATLLTLIFHFLHPLFCVVTYLYWVKDQEPTLGRPMVTAYLAMVIVASTSYLFLASVFYMWAWRFPEPEEVAKRRRIYGVSVNLFFSDIPMFVIETKIVWQVKFVNGMQGFTYCLTCLSIFYSILRVWTFFMVRVIKVRAPVSTSYPRFSLSRPYRHQQPQYGYGQGTGNRVSEYLDADYTPDYRTRVESPGGREMQTYADPPSASRYYYDEDEQQFSPGTGPYSPTSSEDDRRYDSSPGTTRRRL